MHTLTLTTAHPRVSFGPGRMRLRSGDKPPQAYLVSQQVFTNRVPNTIKGIEIALKKANIQPRAISVTVHTNKSVHSCELSKLITEDIEFASIEIGMKQRDTYVEKMLNDWYFDASYRTGHGITFHITHGENIVVPVHLDDIGENRFALITQVCGSRVVRCLPKINATPDEHGAWDEKKHGAFDEHGKVIGVTVPPNRSVVIPRDVWHQVEIKPESPTNLAIGIVTIVRKAKDLPGAPTTQRPDSTSTALGLASSKPDQGMESRPQSNSGLN